MRNQVFAEMQSGLVSSNQSSLTVVPSPVWHLPVLLSPPPLFLSPVPPCRLFVPGDVANLTPHPCSPLHEHVLHLLTDRLGLGQLPLFVQR